MMAGLVDEMYVVISPILLGSGEKLFEGVDLPGLGYQCTRHVATENASHFVLARR
jgi:dihydrofolate reductase